MFARDSWTIRQLPHHEAKIRKTFETFYRISYLRFLFKSCFSD